MLNRKGLVTLTEHQLKIDQSRKLGQQKLQETYRAKSNFTF